MLGVPSGEVGGAPGVAAAVLPTFERLAAKGSEFAAFSLASIFRVRLLARVGFL